ncbi:MAG TPA: protein kinase, partial [Nitrososphaera sp.]|nr:protein kinase [Nitrososphaera sp.]
MRRLLTDRFEPRQILEQTHGKITFVGTDHILEKANVLVKIIRKGHFSCDREALAKFFSWHRGIKHPHLAQVLNAGLTTNEDLYYVREYLDETWLIFSGHTAWIGQLLAAVSVLHSGSQVHGSIRPSNIFQSNGSLKLADPKIFQLKRSELTQEDIRFTAPEVLLGARPSTESD